MLNNPLSFTDPSGFFFNKLFKSIGNFFRSAFRAIGNVFKAMLKSQILQSFIQLAACAAAGPACIAIAPIVTVGISLASGGSLIDAMRAGAITLASAGAWHVPTGASISPHGEIWAQNPDGYMDSSWSRTRLYKF